MRLVSRVRDKVYQGDWSLGAGIRFTMRLVSRVRDKVYQGAGL